MNPLFNDNKYSTKDMRHIYDMSLGILKNRTLINGLLDVAAYAACTESNGKHSFDLAVYLFSQKDISTIADALELAQVKAEASVRRSNPEAHFTKKGKYITNLRGTDYDLEYYNLFLYLRETQEILKSGKPLSVHEKAFPETLYAIALANPDLVEGIVDTAKNYTSLDLDVEGALKGALEIATAEVPEPIRYIPNDGGVENPWEIGPETAELISSLSRALYKESI